MGDRKACRTGSHHTHGGVEHVITREFPRVDYQVQPIFSTDVFSTSREAIILPPVSKPRHNPRPVFHSHSLGLLDGLRFISPYFRAASLGELS
jgi:hypothetical protein